MYHFENSGMCPVHYTSYCAVGYSNYKATKLNWCCWRFDIDMHTVQPVRVGNAFKCMHGIYNEQISCKKYEVHIILQYK